MTLPRLYKQRSVPTTAPYRFFFMGSYIVLLYYLQIYFQSILSVSPIASGVHNLRLVLAAAVFALAGGAAVAKTGRAQQIMFIGSMLATIAIGLISTLDIGTRSSKWVGYQLFVGATMAFAIMHGLSVAQDLAATTSNLLYMYPYLSHTYQYRASLVTLLTFRTVFRTIGGAISTAVGQSVFINLLLAALPISASSVIHS